jgi:hypothetical protein
MTTSVEPSFARRRRAAALQKLVHYLTAFTMLLKGWAKSDHPEGHWPVILLFFAAAAWIAIITVLHDRLHAHVRLLTASVYALECLVTAVMAAVYVGEGKRALPWFWALASLLFLVALVVHLRRTRRGNATPS